MSFQSNGRRNRGEEDEVCPVCKSSRYLNPDMRFLINPECYHKMCESCVDRIFSSGPAPCPVAGCNKTLRKNRFRKQTFEDIGVEREVDVRKRVMQILNRREDEFDNKLAYDNFLEQREDIITNLVSGIDVAKTEAQLSQYAAANSKSIRRNQALESQESAAFLQHQSLEQEQIRLRREAARQDYDNERRAILSGREDVLNRLATGTVEDAEAIAKEGRQGMLKKSSARRSEEERLKRKQGALLAESKRAQALADAADKGIAPAFDSDLVKGLRKIKTPEPEKPYDPFGGIRLDGRDYYQLQDNYPSTYLDPIKDNSQMLAGGYDLREYYARTLLEAFAGLGCFIDEEIAARNASANPSPTGLAASAAASTPIPVDEEML
ncbi:CDK-activating kinase assembly factor MAT1 [Histoplasma capsulatum G186AR]|uniref:RNA polymerase II transcription factor B subunit 3 n=2 Tax=Ajellomyces capsulatus TaxID=5037 RepID=C0NNB1_AJECG|nr:CDK-activating kinase assembly factor MAT1 [Histoplasma capsulatum G186AR]EEH07359.1 CDK-activating kinase assembly factor MAT1 [Histoplasma capsulatum G186AR]KAG5304512.1 CDK-activating kinase assembly factor MAT1 [Histoplasma capsulatum]QSS70110.1 CDK-activating kinase assembly factor MAT1 [Histoplasma capsulatum G186AR]